MASQKSGDSPPSVIPASPGLVSSTLKKYILGLLGEHPSGVPITQLDKLFSRKFFKDAPPRLVELAKSLPEVVCKEYVQCTVNCSSNTWSYMYTARAFSLSCQGQLPSGVLFLPRFTLSKAKRILTLSP